MGTVIRCGVSLCIAMLVAGCAGNDIRQTTNRVTPSSSTYEVANSVSGVKGMVNTAGAGILMRHIFGGRLPEQTAVDGCGRKVVEVEPGKYEPLPGQENIKCPD